MIEQLSQSQGKIYSRAVDPAVESQLRLRETREKTPSPSQAVDDRQVRVRQEHRQDAQREIDARQQQRSTDQQAQEVADKLSQSVKQARMSPARNRSTATWISHTGRQANQSYLAQQAQNLQMVDEIA